VPDGGHGDPSQELTLTYTALAAEVGRRLVSSQGERRWRVAPATEAGGGMASVAR
jgi:hypothetical protein